MSTRTPPRAANNSSRRNPLGNLILALLVSGCVWVLGLPSRARADETQGERIERLEAEIEVLAEELSDLRTGQSAPEQLVTSSQSGLGPAASKIYRAGPGVSIGGYGEIRLRAAVGSQTGLRQGRVTTLKRWKAVARMDAFSSAVPLWSHGKPKKVAPTGSVSGRIGQRTGIPVASDK